MIGVVWTAIKVVYERYGTQIIIQGVLYAYDAYSKIKRKSKK